MTKSNFPGEYHQSSLVTLTYTPLQAAIFVPEKLAERDKAVPAHRDRDLEVNYIVKSHRLDGEWDFTIESEGVTTRIPAPVLERLLAQRNRIIKAHRSAIGKGEVGEGAR